RQRLGGTTPRRCKSQRWNFSRRPRCGRKLASFRRRGVSELAPLTMGVLGGIKVARGEKEFVLPASRKARALLIYLAITGRPHRRDRLCAMFWDMPDDPRGALRSSLSKLRAVFGGPDRRRIVATRDTVRFDAGGMEIDPVGGPTPTGGRPRQAADRGPGADGCSVSR